MGTCLSRFEVRKERKRAQLEKKKELRRDERRQRRARKRKSRQIRASVGEINEERRREWEVYREQKELNAAVAYSNTYLAPTSNHVNTWVFEYLNSSDKRPTCP